MRRANSPLLPSRQRAPHPGHPTAGPQNEIRWRSSWKLLLSRPAVISSCLAHVFAPQCLAHFTITAHVPAHLITNPCFSNTGTLSSVSLMESIPKAPGVRKQREGGRCHALSLPGTFSTTLFCHSALSSLRIK